MTHPTELFEPPRLERERILRLPICDRLRPVQMPSISILHEAKGPGRVLLFAVWLEAKRFEKRIAKPDVGQPRLCHINKERQVVEFRPLATVRSRHASRQQRHVESKLAKQGGERTIQLVAESSTAMADNFVQDRLWLNHDLASQRNIEILKWHREQVRTLKCTEIFCGRVSRAQVADSIEICGDVDHMRDLPYSKPSAGSVRRAPVRFDFRRTQQGLPNHTV